MQSSMQHGQFNSISSVDPNSFELRRCPTHPNYNVEVFCPKEGLEPSVMCIKCYLDPEISKKFNDEPLLALRDLVVKSVDRNNGKISTQKSQLVGDRTESLEQKFLEFNTRDYLGIFERHVESQLKKLDQELDRMKDSLNVFREKFVQFYEKQLEHLKGKEEEIKWKVSQYIEEREEADKRSFRTLEDVLRELNTTEDFREYERFVRLLHKKSQYTGEDEEGSSLKRIIDTMTSMRTLVANMKTIKIDTQILEDIRAKIESMNIVDKSAIIPGITVSDPKIQSTLERIRRTEKKIAPQGTGFSTQQTQHSGGHESEKDTIDGALPYKVRETPKFTRLFDVLKEKENPSPYKDKYPSRNQMDVEAPKDKDYPKPQFAETLQKYTSSPSKHRFSPKSSMDIEKSQERKEPEFPRPRKEYGTPKPGRDQEFQTPRRDQGFPSGKSSLKKDTDNTREKRNQGTPRDRKEFSEKRRDTPNEADPFEFPKSVDKSASESEDKRNLLERLREKYAIETARRSVSKHASDKEDTASQKQQSQEKPNASSAYNPAITDYRSSSVNKPSGKKPSEGKKSETSYPFHWYESRSRLVDEFRGIKSGGNVTDDDPESAPTFSQHDSPGKSPEVTATNSANAKRTNQQTDSKDTLTHVSPNESHLKFAQNSEPNHSVVLPDKHIDYLIDPKQTPEKPGEGLIQQSIDQKLNGYIVFQNTLRHRESDITEEFTKYSSQKWIQLSKAERDEYTALALSQRNELKEEFRRLHQGNKNISELQDLLDQSIKRIRK